MMSVFPHQEDFLTSLIKKEIRETLDKELEEMEDDSVKTTGKVIRDVFFDDKEKIHIMY